MGLREWWASTAPEPVVTETAPVPSNSYDVDVRAQLAATRDMLDMVSEAALDAQMAADEAGWSRLTGDDPGSLTREQLMERVALARVLVRANPLIRRAYTLRYGYVWGGGVSITARSTGQAGEQDVNTVVQAFLDDEATQRVLTGAQARAEMEQALVSDGNVFVALFTNPRTGRVQPRPLPFDQITDVIANPDDATEPWFYRREFTATVLDPAVRGGSRQEQRAELYPALGYRPQGLEEVTAYAGLPVLWDAPVVALQVNRPWLGKWGVPDAYAATTWAVAYRDFLTDWSKLMRALSKIAWRATAADPKRRAARNGLTAALASTTEAGQAAVMSPDVTLEAVPKTGATIDSNSGRPLAAMVAAAMDVPVTMLLGDPGVTGARATAETLDRPTEDAAKARQTLHAAFLRRILGHVVVEAVRAPQGPLRGRVLPDPGDPSRELVVWPDDTDATVDIVWPDLSETPVNVLVAAIVQAESTGKLPPLLAARLLMEALGVEDVDEWLDELTNDAGEFVDPNVSVGQAAADAFRRGEDPAALLAGNPTDLPAGQGDATA